MEKKMAKAFTKGQEVTYISDWDRKGTVTFRHAVVYSCGAKQMVLTDAETGEEMGRHFRPAIGSLEVVAQGNLRAMPGGTFPRMTDEEAVEAGLKIAAAIQAYERELFARCLAAGNGESYNRAIQKDIDSLHDLRVVRYADAAAAIRAAINKAA
jgi:hypothetical protein